MLQTIHRSREISQLEAIFDNELVWWCTAPTDEDPPPPPAGEEDPPPTDPGSDGGGDTGAPYCTTGSRSFIQMVGSGSSATAEYKGRGSFANNTGGDNLRKRIYWYLDGVRVTGSNNGTSTATSNSWNSESNGQSNKQCQSDDNTWSWRARFANLTQGGEENGATYYFKSHALAMTASTPTSSDVEATTAGISCNFVPNARHSTVTAKLEYKKTTDSTWTQAGSTADTNGFSSVGITRGITGLTAETQYDFRLVLSRNSTNETSLTSATASLTTIADVPTVTTDAATSVGPNAATLNGTVDHNTVNGNLSWRYILTSGYSAPPDDSQGTEVSFASNPITGDGSGSKSISGLTASAGYTFWAIYDPTGSESTVFGAAATFTTEADPGAGGDEGDIMIPLQFDGQYGVAKTIYFTLRSPAATNNDNFYSSTAPVQADVKIYHDGAEQGSSSDNAPARIGSTALYSLVLSIAEMSPSTDKELVNVLIIDAAGSAFRDLHIEVRLKQTLSQIDVNADQMSNMTAVTYKGQGTGHGLSAVAGATGQDINGILGEMVLIFGLNEADGSDGTHFELTNMANASSTNDYYNGSIVSIVAGTGIGQARVITDYVGATKIALVDASWVTNPDDTSLMIITAGSRVWDLAASAELSGVPTETSNYGDKLSFLFQRFAFKITQSATTQSWKKSNSSTELGSRSVDDDGSLQSLNKLS